MTRLILPRYGIPDWNTIAAVIARDLGIPFAAEYDDDLLADKIAPEIHIDLSGVPRGRAVDVCDFYLGHHPEIPWRLT